MSLPELHETKRGSKVDRPPITKLWSRLATTCCPEFLIIHKTSLQAPERNYN